MMNNMNTPEGPLGGKVAIVTGGSGFLGQQHCLALLEHGAEVFNFDIRNLNITECTEFIPFNERFHNVICDLSDETSVENSVAKVLEVTKRIDILVNNASIDHKVNSNLSANKLDYRFEYIDLSSWAIESAVGLNGAIFCSKYVARNMIGNKSGVIINISSDLGVIAPDQRIYLKKDAELGEVRYFKPFSYSVIKHGLIGLTKYLSTYLAEYGIRVNTLSPGSILNNQDKEFIANLESNIPMGRMARVDEYKGAIQFLAGDSSSYMTGQNLIVDGGRSIW
jgi:NAD(P)-dependent dehydrogenase (short-subunit alcohol dehydrogenase family)